MNGHLRFIVNAFKFILLFLFMPSHPVTLPLVLDNCWQCSLDALSQSQPHSTANPMLGNFSVLLAFVLCWVRRSASFAWFRHQKTQWTQLTDECSGSISHHSPLPPFRYSEYQCDGMNFHFDQPIYEFCAVVVLCNVRLPKHIGWQVVAMVFGCSLEPHTTDVIQRLCFGILFIYLLFAVCFLTCIHICSSSSLPIFPLDSRNGNMNGSQNRWAFIHAEPKIQFAVNQPNHPMYRRHRVKPVNDIHTNERNKERERRGKDEWREWEKERAIQARINDSCIKRSAKMDTNIIRTDD